MSEHDKEPWSEANAVPGALVSANNSMENLLGIDKEGYAIVMDRDNLRRIIASVNACAGISNAELMAADLEIAVLANVISQRDKLLSALEEILDCISETRGKNAYDKVELGRNLISEIKAGQ